MTRWLVFAICVGLMAPLSACDNDDAPPAEQGPSEGGAGGGPVGCFDPNDPAVHYQSDDPEECRQFVLMCEEGQFGFDNACGCGCIDKGELNCPAPTDPEISWISHDPADCTPEAPSCPMGQLGFSNSCGCGCIQH